MDKNYKLRKTLHLLTNHARLSTKEIAKEVQTTQQNASYINSKLLSDNYVLSGKLLVDSSKFGYNNFCVFLRVKKYSKSFLNALFQELKKYKEITCVDFLFGNFDVFLKFTTPNTSNFNKIFREIINNFGKEITNYLILTQIVQYFYPSNYLSKKRFNHKIIISGDRELVTIDNTDKSIINYLNENSRMNFSHIAAKLKTTSKTIISRIRKLEEKNIIRGYSITLNHKKLNISRYYLFLKLHFIKRNNEAKFTIFVNQQQNVVEHLKTFGEWDSILIVEALDLEDFKKLLFSLKEEFGDHIENYHFIESEEIKQWRYLPEFIL